MHTHILCGGHGAGQEGDDREQVLQRVQQGHDRQHTLRDKRSICGEQDHLGGGGGGTGNGRSFSHMALTHITVNINVNTGSPYSRHITVNN